MLVILICYYIYTFRLNTWTKYQLVQQTVVSILYNPPHCQCDHLWHAPRPCHSVWPRSLILSSKPRPVQADPGNRTVNSNSLFMINHIVSSKPIHIMSSLINMMNIVFICFILNPYNAGKNMMKPGYAGVSTSQALTVSNWVCIASQWLLRILKLRIFQENEKKILVCTDFDGKIVTFIT